MLAAAIAFLSGVAIETLYALGVIWIGERRIFRGSLASVLWGAAFLVGIEESVLQHNLLAAVVWCLGLGVGVVLGIQIDRRLTKKKTT